MNAIIGLHYSKIANNVANVVRSCSAYGVNRVIVTGPRILKALKTCNHRVFRHQIHKHVAVQTMPNMIYPEGYTPVAIEIVPGSQSLPFFNHPEKAFYIFGPEDGSIPSAILRKCHAVVQIPTETWTEDNPDFQCLNLSHAVATVLYDRRMKEITNGMVSSLAV